MIDALTKQPLTLSTDGSAGPYLHLPLTQLEAIRQVLDQHQVYYWVDEHAVSLNDSPYIALINFGRNADPSAIQNILNSAG